LVRSPLTSQALRIGREIPAVFQSVVVSSSHSPRSSSLLNKFSVLSTAIVGSGPSRFVPLAECSSTHESVKKETPNPLWALQLGWRGNFFRYSSTAYLFIRPRVMARSLPTNRGRVRPASSTRRGSRPSSRAAGTYIRRSYNRDINSFYWTTA
jgi:hypothetical protein